MFLRNELKSAILLQYNPAILKKRAAAVAKM
jgi:hypothetical protein